MLVMLGATAGGCVFTSHEIELTATPPSAAEVNIGEGVRLRIVVVDDRDQRVIGQRGVGGAGADVSSPQLVEYLQYQVVQGFQSRGFVVVTDDSPHDISLTFFLRSFKWHTQSGGDSVYVSIRVDATNSETQESFIKSYHYDDKQQLGFFPTTGEIITSRMNAGLSDILAQLFSDDDLRRFLVAAHGRS